MVRDGGAALAALIARMRQDAKAAGGAGDDDALGRRLETAIDGLESAGAWLLARWSDDVASALAGAVPFLMLLGTTAGGWQMARAATIASARRIAGDKSAFWMAKLATARFYSDHFLTQAPGLANAIVSGATGTLAMPEESF
ncbi:MAG: acyl-CoA dehydrogenase C-terminal domain-containing protein [Betaproteobacteria bacterium]|nr:acyl-CoA dehydrogenase C-terminal domain-containing protein [Betaproteobacteria bacterium]